MEASQYPFHVQTISRKGVSPDIFGSDVLVCAEGSHGHIIDNDFPIKAVVEMQPFVVGENAVQIAKVDNWVVDVKGESASIYDERFG